MKNAQEFIDKLCCNEDTPVKVVSIFGNTGDGKSHTLNHTFYGGQEVFNTSALQVGIYLVYSCLTFFLYFRHYSLSDNFDIEGSKKLLSPDNPHPREKLGRSLDESGVWYL